MPFELRCERRLWRAFARFGARPVDPMDQPLPRATKGCLVALFVVVVIVPMPVVALELSRDPDFSWGRVVAWSAVVVIALVALLVMRMLGTSWWMNGAGEPVLALRDGVVRGRLSPASRGAEPYQVGTSSCPSRTWPACASHRPGSWCSKCPRRSQTDSATLRARRFTRSTGNAPSTARQPGPARCCAQQTEPNG